MQGNSGSRQVFTGKTKAQAMVAMKATLGLDALLISQRKVKRGGFLGIGAEEVFELVGERLPPWLADARKDTRRPTRESGHEADFSQRHEGTSRDGRNLSRMKESIAASAREIQRRRGTQGKPAADPGRNWLVGDPLGRSSERLAMPSRDIMEDDDIAASLTRQVGTYGPGGKSLARPERTPRELVAPVDLGGISDLRKEFDALKKELISIMNDAKPASPANQPVESIPVTTGISADSGILKLMIDHMSRSGVPRGLAESIVECVATRSRSDEADDHAVLRSRVAKEIASRIKVAPPLEPNPDAPMIICCVGSTGVGKTTTLAKLGSVFHEGEARSIAYLTLDNYRIAAIEQLRTYSDIQEVPFEEVTTARELGEAIDRHMDKDVILIDTPGRSPHHMEAIDELRGILSELRGEMEILLLISSTTDVRDMEDVIRSFSISDRVRLVFTKTDETMRWGAIFAAAVASALPVAFITTGQSVPDDIEPADPMRIADAVLGEPDGRSRPAGTGRQSALSVQRL